MRNTYSQPHVRKVISGENIIDIEAIENTHVTVGVNDFLAGRD